MVKEVETTNASLQSNAINKMYKLWQLDIIMNKQFLDAFKIESLNLVEMVRKWWNDEKTFNKKGTLLYPI